MSIAATCAPGSYKPRRNRLRFLLWDSRARDSVEIIFMQIVREIAVLFASNEVCYVPLTCLLDVWLVCSYCRRSCTRAVSQATIFSGRVLRVQTKVAIVDVCSKLCSTKHVATEHDTNIRLGLTQSKQRIDTVMSKTDCVDYFIRPLIWYNSR